MGRHTIENGKNDKVVKGLQEELYTLYFDMSEIKTL